MRDDQLCPSFLPPPFSDRRRPCLDAADRHVQRQVEQASGERIVGARAHDRSTGEGESAGGVAVADVEPHTNVVSARPPGGPQRATSESPTRAVGSWLQRPADVGRPPAGRAGRERRPGGSTHVREVDDENRARSSRRARRRHPFVRRSGPDPESTGQQRMALLRGKRVAGGWEGRGWRSTSCRRSGWSRTRSTASSGAGVGIRRQIARQERSREGHGIDCAGGGLLQGGSARALPRF